MKVILGNDDAGEARGVRGADLHLEGAAHGEVEIGVLRLQNRLAAAV